MRRLTRNGLEMDRRKMRERQRVVSQRRIGRERPRLFSLFTPEERRRIRHALEAEGIFFDVESAKAAGGGA